MYFQYLTDMNHWYIFISSRSDVAGPQKDPLFNNQMDAELTDA